MVGFRLDDCGEDDSNSGDEHNKNRVGDKP